MFVVMYKYIYIYIYIYIYVYKCNTYIHHLDYDEVLIFFFIFLMENLISKKYKSAINHDLTTQLLGEEKDMSDD